MQDHFWDFSVEWLTDRTRSNKKKSCKIGPELKFTFEVITSTTISSNEPAFLASGSNLKL